jgi:hypothetical protein
MGVGRCLRRQPRAGNAPTIHYASPLSAREVPLAGGRVAGERIRVRRSGDLKLAGRSDMAESWLLPAIRARCRRGAHHGSRMPGTVISPMDPRRLRPETTERLPDERPDGRSGSG